VIFRGCKEIGREAQCKDELYDRERRGQRQVEQADRLIVDLDFQGGEARPAQHKDHPERSEIEDEDQERGRSDRRHQQRQQDVA
jgi:hypothetical protein